MSISLHFCFVKFCGTRSCNFYWFGGLGIDPVMNRCGMVTSPMSLGIRAFSTTCQRAIETASPGAFAGAAAAAAPAASARDSPQQADMSYRPKYY
eukprot:4395299-Amphidinium_carterae.1